jgi:protein required for attachment to host cells
MSKLRIPHDAFVFVGDGLKALFLRNEGDEFHADVKSRIIAEIDKDLTHHPVGEIEKHLVG